MHKIQDKVKTVSWTVHTVHLHTVIWEVDSGNSALQYTTVHFSTNKHTTSHLSTLYYTKEQYSKLQYTQAHYSTLKYTVD